jgi:hypothetical protein
LFVVRASARILASAKEYGLKPALRTGTNHERDLKPGRRGPAVNRRSLMEHETRHLDYESPATRVARQGLAFVLLLVLLLVGAA